MEGIPPRGVAPPMHTVLCFSASLGSAVSWLPAVPGSGLRPSPSPPQGELRGLAAQARWRPMCGRHPPAWAKDDPRTPRSRARPASPTLQRQRRLAHAEGAAPKPGVAEVGWGAPQAEIHFFPRYIGVHLSVETALTKMFAV